MSAFRGKADDVLRLQQRLLLTQNGHLGFDATAIAAGSKASTETIVA